MEEELPLDSDSSDEDYVPGGIVNDVSEEESGNDSVDDEPDNDDKAHNGSSLKRKKYPKAKIKKKMMCIKTEEEEKENSVIETEEERKKKSDLLWADFMKDCGPPAKENLQAKTEDETPCDAESKPKISASSKLESPKVSQVLTFAGEEIRVEKPLPPARGGPSRRGAMATSKLSSVLGQLGKKGKLSTLEKSKLDWDSFKVKEGIMEDLERHNKGRNGYLEKQDFLQRADLRQFEIEKNMRSSTRRSLNR